jgi:hypothetical protein
MAKAQNSRNWLSGINPVQSASLNETNRASSFQSYYRKKYPYPTVVKWKERAGVNSHIDPVGRGACSDSLLRQDGPLHDGEETGEPGVGSGIRRLRWHFAFRSVGNVECGFCGMGGEDVNVKED